MRRGARLAPPLLCAAFGAAACDLLMAPREPAPPGTMEVAGNPIGPVPGVGEPAPQSNPKGDDAGIRANGRSLFVGMNCYGCHGEHGGGGMGPSLRDDVWIYGGAAGDIYDSIARGRANGMPAWGSLLPEDLIWNVTAYVQSLGTPNEVEPPQ
jgi:cytochrome c oxidase cbb3-type subunit 3